jgi:hypothetical protein
MCEIIVTHFYILFYYKIYSIDFGLNILKKWGNQHFYYENEGSTGCVTQLLLNRAGRTGLPIDFQEGSTL